MREVDPDPPDHASPRSSLRFGLGRFNTPDDIESAIAAVTQVVGRLRKLSSMA